jgi:hypothetical protein
MSCYLNHLTDVLEEAGVEVSKANRKAIHARLSAAVGLPDARCPEVWKRIKEWRADARRRGRLVEALRAPRRQA